MVPVIKIKIKIKILGISFLFPTMIEWVNVIDLREIFLPLLKVILYLYIGEVACNKPCVISIQIKSQQYISTRINHVHVLNGIRILTNTLLSNNSTIRVAINSRHIYWILLQQYAKLATYLEYIRSHWVSFLLITLTVLKIFWKSKWYFFLPCPLYSTNPCFMLNTVERNDFQAFFGQLIRLQIHV